MEYYTVNQLESRIKEIRAEIRSSERKTLTELIVASFFLAYVWDWEFAINVTVFSAWFSLPVLLNVSSWILWSWLRFQRIWFRPLGSESLEPSFEPEELSDEYREYQYLLSRTRRRESLFDILTAFQFVALVAGFLLAPFVRF